jgi:hypothetical protein
MANKLIALGNKSFDDFNYPVKADVSESGNNLFIVIYPRVYTLPKDVCRLAGIAM